MRTAPEPIVSVLSRGVLRGVRSGDEVTGGVSVRHKAIMRSTTYLRLITGVSFAAGVVLAGVPSSASDPCARLAVPNVYVCFKLTPSIKWLITYEIKESWLGYMYNIACHR
jgi:hypothetical protein